MRRLMLTLALFPAIAGAEERFPRIPPEQMTAEQRALAAAIQSGPRAAVPGRDNSIGGPFNVWLRSPGVGDRLQQLGSELRFRTSLPAALNEFAILITAREWSPNTSGTRTTGWRWQRGCPLPSPPT